MRGAAHLGVAAALALLLASGLTEARPGGGQGYSGGSSPSRSYGGGSSPSYGSRPSYGSSPSYGGGSSPSKSGGSSPSSSGGSSSGGIPVSPEEDARNRRRIAEIMAQQRTNTLLGGALFIAVLVGAGFIANHVGNRKRGTGWSTANAPVRPDVRSALVAGIREKDPDFSIILFEDFLGALVTEAHTARGSGSLDRLAPWLLPEVRHALAARTVGPVSSIVIGGIRILFFDRGESFAVAVEVELCFTEQSSQGKRWVWAQEHWIMVRWTGAQSRPPRRVRTFDCPGCGAPLDKKVGTCRHCNRVIDRGKYDWYVTKVSPTSLQAAGPDLTGYAPERGTNLPTVFDPGVERAVGALKARDQTFDDRSFTARVGVVFSTMQQAWTSLDWERARPFLGDNLFESQRYWIESYRRSGLRNVTERARVLGIELVRITEDRWYDALTVRVHATGLDYTLRDADQAVVGGDRYNERRYSEYWTFIRGRGASKPGLDKPLCPSCGAALETGMVTVCKHCDAKVTLGAFDWVLARIEQDEAYAG